MSSSRSNTSFHTATSKSTSGSTTSNNNNHVKEILEKAYDTLQRVAGTELPSLKENTVATDVDEAIINMVQAFNTMDIDHRVSLYNGINGVALVTLDPVADKQFKNHVFILLGHTLVTLSEATLPKQLGVLSVSPPGALIEKVRRNVHVEGHHKGLEEVATFDATIKKKVRQTGSPLTVISYSLGRKLRYALKDPEKQKIDQNQYLYQGIVPEQYRKKGQTFCYVLSKFPPTRELDVATMHVKADSPLLLGGGYDPMPMDQTGGEGFTIIATVVGIGTTFLSSLAMLL